MCPFVNFGFPGGKNERKTGWISGRRQRAEKAVMYKGDTNINRSPWNYHKEPGTETERSGYPYLPTPPLGQDMTQVQFLSEV